MRPRRVVLVEASTVSLLEQRVLRLDVWGYDPRTWETLGDARLDLVVMEGLYRVDAVYAMARADVRVPVLLLVPGLDGLGWEGVRERLQGQLQGYPNVTLYDPLAMGEVAVRERIRVLLERKRGPRRQLPAVAPKSAAFGQRAAVRASALLCGREALAA